jgi:hypothetical protein
MREKIREILDNYYGNSKSDDFKEELIDFLETEGYFIVPVLIKEFGKELHIIE